MKPIAIIASGMVTSVGLDAASSCAAIRCAIDNFTETRFMDRGGEWIIGAQVPLEKPWRGLSKLVHMAAPAIRECLGHSGQARPHEIPLLLCVAEKERPGRIDGLDDLLLPEIEAELGIRFHPRSGVIAKGRVGGALAMGVARNLIHDEGIPLCLIAGVDSLLVGSALRFYDDRSRLLTSKNSNGFIPGEASASILVGLPSVVPRSLRCFGLGLGREEATLDSELPLRGDGMVQALKAALTEANCQINDFDYRITDTNGEQYWFKEATLALDRILRKRSELFEIWHPVDCLGEIGSAIGPAAFAIAERALAKRYAFGRGPVCHFGNDNGDRAAVVLGGEQ